MHAQDPCGGAAANLVVALSVAAANCAPVVAAIARQIVTELSTLTVTPAASDGDGDTLSWTGSALPLGATVAPSTGVFTWTPMLGTAGTYTGLTLTAVDGHGGSAARSFDVTVQMNTTGIDVRFLPAPTSLRIAEAVPNPFADHVTFVIGMPHAARGTVSMWNAAGQQVATWAARPFLAGYNPFVWDGRDMHGSRLPAGSYMVRIDAGDAHSSRSVVLVH